MIRNFFFFFFRMRQVKFTPKLTFFKEFSLLAAKKMWTCRLLKSIPPMDPFNTYIHRIHIDVNLRGATCLHIAKTILESSELVPLTYEVSEWSLSSCSVRAWRALPRDGARSYLGRSLGGADRAHCFRKVLDSPLSANIRSPRRTPVCIAYSW